MSIPYTFQNQTGPIPLSELDANFTATRTDLANTSSPALGTGLVGWFRSLANFVGRTLGAKLSDQYSVCDYGAVGDGATDNSTFLANCPATDLLVPPGTYLVNSNTTIAANLRFAAGAILKPASGVTITLGAPFTAPKSQVFDTSAGGAVAVAAGQGALLPQWWGALGNNVHDDTAAIQAAINAASTGGATNEVRFIPGNYKVTSTLTVTAQGFTFTGENRWGNGPQLTGATSGMGDVMLVNTSGVGNYGFKMRGIRIQCASGLASPPNGLHLKDVSEAKIADCTFGPYLIDGLKLNGTDIVICENVVTTTNANAVHLTVSGTSVFTANSAIWFTHGNVYNSSGAAFLIDAAYDNIKISDTWVEWAPYCVAVNQLANQNIIGTGLQLFDVEFANGNTSPFPGAQFFKALGQNTASYYFSLAHTRFVNCKSVATATPAAYQIQFLMNGNSHASSSFNWSEVAGGVYQGSTNAVVNTDVAYPGSPSMLTGNIEAVNASNATIPLTSGFGTWGVSGLNQSTEILYFKGMQGAASVSPDFIFNTGAARSGGNAVYQIQNNGSNLFQVTDGGNVLGKQFLATVGTTTVGGISSSGGLLPGQLNSGGVISSSFIYSGSGVPANTYGNNGDFYFRSDTPGTTNQRLYVKNAGAWAGVL